VPAGVLFLGNDLGGIPSSAWIHFFCLAILVLLGPYGFYAAHEQKRVRLLEERFPDFLRDLASSHKGGLTLTSAIKVSARGDYGPLTPEVQRMADQVSWNVGFQEVLQRFAERVATPLVQRAVTLILQADRSGGSTTEVLLAAARDAREIKTLETERRLAMSLYTVVIYVTFLVFLGVASVLYAQFVPQLVAANQAAAAQSKLASLGQFVGSSLRLADFQLFYLLAAVMQGLGDGIVAGQMGSGKAVLGLRHSFVMVLLSYVCFALFLR
jgi:flagellar protein FlaJ